MIERKAIFVSQDKLTNLHNENKILVIFDLEANRVVGVETIALKKMDMPTEVFLLYLRRKSLVSGKKRNAKMKGNPFR